MRIFFPSINESAFCEWVAKIKRKMVNVLTRAPGQTKAHDEERIKIDKWKVGTHKSHDRIDPSQEENIHLRLPFDSFFSFKKSLSFACLAALDW
jgi:hypothetical protein